MFIVTGFVHDTAGIEEDLIETLKRSVPSTNKSLIILKLIFCVATSPGLIVTLTVFVTKSTSPDAVTGTVSRLQH